MASVVPSPPAAAAWRKMNNLLEDNFDTASGVYKNEFSDERVAKESGLSPSVVKDYRTSAFGKLKPPSELDTAIRDLRELEALFLKSESEIKEKLKDLQARVRSLQKRFD